ncbi:hypothetical protein O7623_00925 [Solwaraspora sp. WMMD791]|uniref:hypothetical protein n=1 Tax=Solwaraspora sp. WMMD791 TaxID=3016086 RepID=UPI00249C9327|nr:hypothetical protein [Solwaraspora sp. WMMD791]WFE27809.1 hypothetical protein O7623_00925 [Solwaraspora sp. WMMD791]
MFNRTRYDRNACTCNNTGRCGLCPSIAVTATREAQLPAGSPGQRAADRIARRAGQAAGND